MKGVVNMRGPALAAWYKNPLHRVGTSPASWRALKRLRRSASTPVSAWSVRDHADRERALAAQVRAWSRMRKFGKALPGQEVSRLHVVLRNYGHDVTMSSSPLYEQHLAWACKRATRAVDSKSHHI